MSLHSAGESSAHLFSGRPELDRSVPPDIAARATPLYSARANVVVAFFGGVYAILLFSFLNSRRLGRARADGALYVALAVLWTLSILWLTQSADFGGLAALLVPAEQRRDFQLLSRAASLAAFGVLYLRLRPRYLAEHLEAGPAETLKAGLVALLVGMAATLLVGAIGLALR